jgi:predicted transcriptional regulator
MDEIKMTIRLTPELHERLGRVADYDHRSKHGQMLAYIERGVTQDERAQRQAASRAASAGRDHDGPEQG